MVFGVEDVGGVAGAEAVYAVLAPVPGDVFGCEDALVSFLVGCTE